MQRRRWKVQLKEESIVRFLLPLRQRKQRTVAEHCNVVPESLLLLGPQNILVLICLLFRGPTKKATAVLTEWTNEWIHPLTHPPFMDQYYKSSSVHRTRRCRVPSQSRRASSQPEKAVTERTVLPNGAGMLSCTHTCAALGSSGMWVTPTPRKRGQVGPQGGHLSRACGKDWRRAVWAKPTPGWGTALTRAQMQEGAFQEAALFGVTNVKSAGGQPESSAGA